MKNNYLAKQKRQFKGLCKKISKNWETISTQEQETLLSRFRRLYGNLKSAFARPALKKMMGAAALVLITVGNINGQYFKDPLRINVGGGEVNPALDIGSNSNPTFVDLDDDGDLDLFVGASDGSFHYIQNNGTATTYSFANSAIVNPFGLTDIGYGSSASFGDLDGDGDLDMISGETYGSFYFFENTGNVTSPNFSTVVVDTFNLVPIVGTNGGAYNLGVVNPALVDIDNDGDLDLITGDTYGSFYFYENDGTASNPSFLAGVQDTLGITQIAPGGLGSNLTSPSFGDLDGDGDLDMISGGRYGEFVYFENNGSISNPAFLAQSVNPFSLDSVPGGGVARYSMPAFVDIDDDGDLDMFSGHISGIFYFYENDTTSIPSAIVENEMWLAISLYPNPVSEELTIELSTSANYQIRITDLTGREVYSEFVQNDNNLQLSTQAWPAGLYLLQVRDEEGRVETKKVIKR